MIKVTGGGAQRRGANPRLQCGVSKTVYAWSRPVSRTLVAWSHKLASRLPAYMFIYICAEVTRRSLAEAAPESVPTPSAGPSISAGMSDGGPDSYQVPSFVPIPYTHLWVSSDGNTHIAECKLQNLLLSSYIGGQGGLQAQSYRETLPSPSSELIIQLAANQYNPPHTAPSSQFVSVLSGRW